MYEGQGKWTSIVTTCALSISSTVFAGYVVTPLSGGLATLTVNRGAVFDLDVVLTSDNGALHNSAIFRLEFEEAGLHYLGYTWAAPYLTGSIFDDSAPFAGDLPVILGAGTLAGAGYADGVVDVELSNVIGTGARFSDGLLVSLRFLVPDDFVPPSLSIGVAVDTFADGFTVVDASSGSPFELIVVPAPLTSGVFLVGAGFGISPRRRRTTL